MNFVFNKCVVKSWSGRYATIPGKKSGMKIKSVAGRTCPVVLWEQEVGTGICCAIDSSAVRAMTEAILAGKRNFGGGGGGAFLINEYGQVLVPSSDGKGSRAIVGEIEGKLLFEDPFQDDSVLDISNDTGLGCGDPWPMPYVGIPYNLSKRSEIYFYRQMEDGGQTEKPIQQDEELIANIRSIRRSGPVKFIVNPYGIVLTKKPTTTSWTRNEKWEPVFVGRISQKTWFSKEG